VIRIDPRSNLVVATIPATGRLRDVVIGEGAVWVLDTGALQCSVVRIDSQKNVVAATIALGASPQGLAVGDGFVWVALEGGTGRIDPQTSQIVGPTISIHFGPLAVGESGVWFAGFDREGRRRIAHLNSRAADEGRLRTELGT
jgi:streptogramin lyase